MGPHQTRTGSDAAPRTPAEMAAIQRTAGNRAASVTVQRAGEASTSAPPPVEESAQEDRRGAAVITRLSRSIEGHVVVAKMKTNPLAPGTWWPEHWMPDGPMRLKRTLERRVISGELFGAQDLEDIRTLSEVNPQWLAKVGIGTFKESEDYIEGDYKDWLRNAPGKRILAATLAFQKHAPGTRAAGAPAPIAPDYTLGRFMTTKAPEVSEEEKRLLRAERDEQIRQTAVDTLHPAGIAAERRHPDADKPGTAKHAAKDAKARDVFTSVLLLLQHGLKTYDPQEGVAAHVDYREGDVVRALAHGGRVNIRIPALRGGESPQSLTDFLGVTDGGQRAGFVDKRPFATHRTAIEKNKEGGEPGKFQEKGGIGASVANYLTPAVPHVGPERPQLMGMDISGGGFGSRDWNGDVVLPNGSYGHMLLILTPPTAAKDGSLLVGIETIKPHAESPVGYVHNARSTEATANPESVLHGHKGDKVGTGGLKHNERLVELRELGKAQGSGDWRAFLDQIKREWLDELEKNKDDVAEQRKMYERLVGRRQHFYEQTVQIEQIEQIEQAEQAD
ncbi:PE-PGRS family protein [Streptomyces sp. NBC_01728]|uniref:PE-PGRS family protein n=1 Tax=unclassified Streptomyces TaxID=2593676 RepID=UPI002256552A|nr:MULTISPECIES: PE-PGRS family protein [unclassified Streptomyces]MCX4453772.1 PE-PGRS family protein [Streptomyces sp. NBC_01719]MCX4493132.1 PE-PGRS family protein [Streptomyces sp. NBC_01728]